MILALKILILTGCSKITVPSFTWELPMMRCCMRNIRHDGSRIGGVIWEHVCLRNDHLLVRILCKNLTHLFGIVTCLLTNCILWQSRLSFFSLQWQIGFCVLASSTFVRLLGSSFLFIIWMFNVLLWKFFIIYVGCIASSTTLPYHHIYINPWCSC